MTGAWEKPIPFDDHERLPAFPVDALSGWLADFVVASADALQVPADLPGMLALAALATATAGRWRVEVRDGYGEPLNLFVLVAMPPGSRKSAAFALATAPIVDHERALVREQRATVAARRAERRTLERALKRAESQAAKATDPDERQVWLDLVRKTAVELDDFGHPALPRLVVDDVTPARLARMLAEQKHVAVLSSESGAFGQMAAEGALDLYLKSHAGDPITIERVGRPSSEVSSPALTVGLTVQPDVLRDIAARPGFRGRGLLARFLYALPPSMMGARCVDSAPVTEPVLVGYRDGLRQLLAVEGPRRALALSSEAEARWRVFAAELEPRLGENGDLASIVDWAAKLPGAVARLSGLLHLAEHGAAAHEMEVSTSTVEHATIIGNYFVDHARAAFGAMAADAGAEDAKHVLAWVERSGSRSFRERECFEAVKGTLRKMARLRAALTQLEERAYVRRIASAPRSGPGRRPSPRWEVNPTLLGPPTLAVVSTNSANCMSAGEER